MTAVSYVVCFTDADGDGWETTCEPHELAKVIAARIESGSTITQTYTVSA